MNQRDKIQRNREKIEELNRCIELCEGYKRRIVRFVSDTEKEYNAGKLDHVEYKAKLFSELEWKSAEQWMEYYDRFILEYRSQISILSREIPEQILQPSISRQTKLNKQNIFIFLILLITFGSLLFIGPFFNFSHGPTGFVVSSVSPAKTSYSVNETIGSNVTIIIKANDILPESQYTNLQEAISGNLTNVTVYLRNGAGIINQSSMVLSTFLKNSNGSSCINNSAVGTRWNWTDTDLAAAWEFPTNPESYGIGYAASSNAPCSIPTYYAVDIINFFPAGLKVPSAADTYTINVSVSFNATAGKPITSSVQTFTAGFVIFNQSELDIGIVYTKNNNTNSSVNITSNGTNNNVVVSCLPVPGNCTNITSDWTTMNMVNGQSNRINFSCNDSNGPGVINAFFNVTSAMDTVESNISVNCTVLQTNVSFNSSSLSLGSGKVDEGNLAGFTWVNSTGQNNGINVSCLPVPGNCTTITSDWIYRIDLANNTANKINFTCDDAAVGAFTAFFNATSKADTAEENMSVSCTITPQNQMPADPSNFMIQDNAFFCAGQEDQWDNIGNNTHMDNRTGALLNWTNGTDADNNNVKTRLCISSLKSCSDLQTDLADGTNEVTNAANDCDVTNAWGNNSALSTPYYNITNATYRHNGSAVMFFVVAATSIDDATNPTGSANIICYNFSLNNTLPAGSAAIKVGSSNTNKTHINGTTEKYLWTAGTDADTTAGKDHCPVDTIVHNLRLGNKTFGNDTYFTGQVANPATGTSPTNGIPFNTTLDTVVGFTFNSTIYAQMWVDDNLGGNESRANETLTLYNTIPTSPTNFTINITDDQTHNQTHDQTPYLNWTNSTDAEGDNITYHIIAGTTQGSNDLLTEKMTYTYPGDDDFFSTIIPWGTDGMTTGWINRTVYVTVWAVDNISDQADPAYTANRTALNAVFNLTDHLPYVDAVYIGDSIGYEKCSLDTLTAGCSITPQIHSNATNIAIQINATDLDADCDTTGNGFARIFMCAYNYSDYQCNPQHYNYTWAMEAVTRAGTNCTYNLSINLTAGNHTMQFWVANSTSYVYYVNVSDQAGQRPNETGDVNVNGTWRYSALTAVNYSSAITLGGAGIILNTWSAGVNAYTMANWGNVILDIQWNSTNATSGPTSTWILSGTDMEIDDDNARDADAGNLASVAIAGPLDSFIYATGLQRCISDACDDATQTETMPTYWHILPEGTLPAGTYSLNITYVLSKHS